MSLRPAEFRHCEACGRGTGHDKRGRCMVCKSKAKSARRETVRAEVNRALQASGAHPLVRYGDLLKVADTLWSTWLRAAGDGCVKCLTPLPPERLQCAHGITREDRVIRFDPDNTFRLCAACHRRHTPPRRDWDDWRLKHLGPERFARIDRLSRVGGKLTLSDLHLVVLDAQRRIAALPEGPRKAWARERVDKLGARVVRIGVRLGVVA